VPVLRELFDRRERRELTGLQEILDSRLGTKTFSGKHVTPENALGVSAVYACVTLIAESIAMLPGDVLQRDGNRRIPQPDHPYQRLLFENPNPELTSNELWSQTIGWQLIRGNGYIYAPSNRTTGLVEAIWPLAANRVEVVRVRETGRLGYIVNFGRSDLERPPGVESGSRVGFDQRDVWHFRAFGSGPIGYSPIWLGRQGVGVSMAAEEYEARFFDNDATPGGVIQVPKTLSKEAYDRLVANWNTLHQGAKQAHLIGLLEEGGQWQDTGLSNEDAQFLELRRFQLQEIMRWFGPIPPHLISDVTPATSWGTGIEQQGLGFVRYCLGRWISRNERTINKRLLAGASPPGLYAKWNVKALERADLRARAAALHIMRLDGVVNADEWRAIEDMEPIGGDAGEAYLNPLNFAPVDAEPMTEENVRELVAVMVAELNGHR